MAKFWQIWLHQPLDRADDVTRMYTKVRSKCDQHVFPIRLDSIFNEKLSGADDDDDDDTQEA